MAIKHQSAEAIRVAKPNHQIVKLERLSPAS